MDNHFWKIFAWSYFAVQTWCIFLMLEIILTGKVYLNLFIAIFAAVLYLNRHLIWRRHANKV